MLMGLSFFSAIAASSNKPFETYAGKSAFSNRRRLRVAAEQDISNIIFFWHAAIPSWQFGSTRYDHIVAGRLE